MSSSHSSQATRKCSKPFGKLFTPRLGLPSATCYLPRTIPLCALLGEDITRDGNGGSLERYSIGDKGLNVLQQGTQVQND